MGLSDEYVRQAARSEAERVEDARQIWERAQLIARMVSSGNTAARAQAVAAIERGCYAEALLAAIRSLPSHEDLMTNPVARAMYELANRPSVGASDG